MLNTIDELIHYLFCILRIPVSYYYENRPKLILPSGFQTVSLLLYGNNPLEELFYSKGQCSALQFLTNRFNEEYIYFEVEENKCVLIGPFLLLPMREGNISNLIARHSLPLKKKNILVQYYSGLQVLEEQQIYYIGHFLKNVVSSKYGSTEDNSYADNMTIQSAPNDSSILKGSRFRHSPFFLEQEISRMITKGDMEGAKKVLTKINSTYKAILADEPVRSLKNSLIGSCGVFARAAIAGGVSPEDAFTKSDVIILEIERTSTLNKLNALEIKMVRDFTEMVRDVHQKNYSPSILKTIEFIQEHLTEKLSLPLLAEQVFLHENYLSNLFHKEVGITISAYVRLQRIKAAKNNVRNGTDKIADIAAFYCFSSESHFVKVFKEQTGVTPKNYRRIPE